MSHEQVIGVISKPPHVRTNNEIEVILPWLRKKSTLLAGMNKNVIIDVVRGCQYQRSQKEDVVIKQGDKGECFYIILNGLVSVYIDAMMSGEDEMGSKSDEDEKKKKEEEEKKNAGEDNEDEGEKDGEKEEQPDAEKAEESNAQPSNSQAPPGGQNGNDSSGSQAASVAAPTPKTPKVSLFKRKTLGSLAKKITHQQRQKKHLERKSLGKFIVRFETGKSFGEIALLSEDNVRNASIITDDVTDFLVIHRDLYNSTLKAFQEQEYKEVKDFIESQPLFFDWPPKFLNLLRMSMRKETFNINSPIVSQGDEVDGLIFITSGESKIVVEPARHRGQYPERWPFKDKYAVFEDDEFMRSRFGKKSAHGKRPRKGSAKAIKSKHVSVRRYEGYAAAEKKAFQRSSELCFLVKGDIIGDIETVMSLPTYAYSVLCTSETRAFILDSKNYDRLITKKNPDTSVLLRDLVEIKLKNRTSTPQGAQIPLLRHLYFSLTKATEEEVVTKQLTARNSKELPDKEILLQYLLDCFVQWKAPLIKPYVPGNVYYKTLMQERARIRANVRQQQMKMERRPTVATLPNTLRKQFNERKPRSISALKTAMKKLKSDKVSDVLSPRREFLYRGADAIREEQEREEEEERNDRKELAATREAKESSGRTSLLDVPTGDHRKDSLVRFEDENPTEIRTQSSERVLENRPKTTEAIQAISRANTFTGVDAGRAGSKNNETDDGNKNNETDDGNNNKETVFITERPDRLHLLPAILSASRQAAAKSLTPPPRGGDELNLPTIEGNESRLRFYSQYVRDHVASDDDDDEFEFKDYETSDSKLSFLETRLQNFLSKGLGARNVASSTEESPRSEINLPKLKRFSCEDPTVKAPKPGGRVMVKRHACKFAHCNFVVKGHRHSKYFMVDELPRSARTGSRYSERNVKNAQMVMDVFMGGLLQRKKSQSAKPAAKSTLPT